MNIALWLITGILLIFSSAKSKEKTISALITAYKKFVKILPLFLIVMAGFALVVTFLSPQIIKKYIGAESGIRGIAISLGLGSVSMMPGFAAFPLCAALKGEGIPFYILAAFSLSLMNVGIVTFPIEKRFIGSTVGIIRNFVGLLICIIAVIVFKIVFVE